MKYHQNVPSFGSIYNINEKSKTTKYIVALILILLFTLFVPWTQNIRSKGKVTTLRQEQRAQNLNTIIGGRIIKWYVKEGDMVNIGDTIAQIAEIKDDYLDPELLSRTDEQLSAKRQSVDFYQAKVDASRNQIEALETGLKIKIRQLENKISQQNLKIKSDSATLSAAQNDYSIAIKQYDRQKELFDKGLVSLTQLEQRNITLQTSQARQITAQNNLNNSKQELDITYLELKGTQQDYLDKINKARGEMMQAMSQIASGQGDVAKLRNQYSNYSQRNKLYFIIAPQDGQIVQAKRSGIGEVVKEGETIVQIVPKDIEYAVEIFVDPLDVPLLNKGQTVRFIFDGFPAIVFSGWPQASYGTFGGIVNTIENNLSPEGKYRVLVKQDPKDRPWPHQLRLGNGAQSIALLKDVPIWYELWRNINGFPPDYYKHESNEDKKEKK